MSRVPWCSYTTRAVQGPHLSTPHPDFLTLAPVAAPNHKHKVTGDSIHQHLLRYREKGKSQAGDHTPELVASQSQDSY